MYSMADNLLSKLTPGSSAPFQWENASTYTALPGGGIRMAAPAKSDFFQDPAGVLLNDSAPYLYLPVTGDFVVRAHVTHPFRATYDAAALLVRSTATQWAKLCFEGTDFGTHAIVSVITNRTSDDANGVNYHWPAVWLQVVRTGNVFAMHYAPDGEQWQMVRVFRLDLPETVKVGMVAQSPIGSGTEADFLSFSLEPRTVSNIRAGI
jgi:uncharacterized protein